MAQSADVRQPWVPTCPWPPVTRGPADQCAIIDNYAIASTQDVLGRMKPTRAYHDMQERINPLTRRPNATTAVSSSRAQMYSGDTKGLARSAWELSGKVPDKWNYTSLIPDVFAAFVVTVVGGMNERCAIILSNQISFDQLQKESMRIAGILQRYTFREIWPYSTWKLAYRIVIGWLAVTVIGRTINDRCFQLALLSVVPLLL